MNPTIRLVRILPGALTPYFIRLRGKSSFIYRLWVPVDSTFGHLLSCHRSDPVFERIVRRQTLGEQDGNRRLCLLNCLVDRVAGLFYGPVAGPAALSLMEAVQALRWDGHTGREQTDPGALQRPRGPLAPRDEGVLQAWEKCPESGFWTPKYGYVDGSAARFPRRQRALGGRQPCPPGCRPPLTSQSNGWWPTVSRRQSAPHRDGPPTTT